MPKAHQVVPAEAQVYARQRTTIARPSSAGATRAPATASSSSSRHYFQQFSETKRVVKNFLGKSKTEKAIAMELTEISSNYPVEMSSSLPTATFRQGLDRTADRNASRSSNLEVHHAINPRAYTVEDMEHFHQAFFTEPREAAPAPTASPDKPFDESRAARVKKPPKKIKFTNLELKHSQPLGLFPEWMAMRDKYLGELESIAVAVVTRAAGTDILQLKRNFLALTSMLQHLTLKIVEFYLDNCAKVRARFGISGEGPFMFVKDFDIDSSSDGQTLLDLPMLRWQELEKYVEQLPTSLNWLEENPFRLWTGVHFTFNPLMSCYDMQGDLAVILNETLHEILQSRNARSSFLFEPNAEEPHHHEIGSASDQQSPEQSQQSAGEFPIFVPEVMQVMAAQLRYELPFHRRMVRANAGLQQIYQNTVERWKAEQAAQQVLLRREAEEQTVSLDMARYNRLTFLLFGCERQEVLDGIANEVLRRHLLFERGRFLALWQRTRYYMVVCRYMARRRAVRIYVWVLRALQRRKFQQQRLDALRLRCQHHLLEITWDMWQKQRLWWKSYSLVSYHSQRSRRGVLFERWKLFVRLQRQHRLQCLWPVLQAATASPHRSTSAVRAQSQSQSPSAKIRTAHTINEDDDARIDGEEDDVPTPWWSSISQKGSLLRSSFSATKDLLQSFWGDAAAAETGSAVAESEGSDSRRYAAEESVMVDLAHSTLLRKWSFRRWRRAYQLHRALRLWSSISETVQKRQAWLQWRFATRELRFEDRVRLRTAQLLQEVFPPQQFARENSNMTSLYDDDSADSDEDGTSTIASQSASPSRRMSTAPQAAREWMTGKEDWSAAELEAALLVMHSGRSPSGSPPAARRKSQSRRGSVSFNFASFLPLRKSCDRGDDRDSPTQSRHKEVAREVPVDFKPARALQDVPVVYRKRHRSDASVDPLEPYEEIAAAAAAAAAAESAADVVVPVVEATNSDVVIEQSSHTEIDEVVQSTARPVVEEAAVADDYVRVHTSPGEQPIDASRSRSRSRSTSSSSEHSYARDSPSPHDQQDEDQHPNDDANYGVDAKAEVEAEVDVAQETVQDVQSAEIENEAMHTSTTADEYVNSSYDESTRTTLVDSVPDATEEAPDDAEADAVPVDHACAEDYPVESHTAQESTAGDVQEVCVEPAVEVAVADSVGDDGEDTTAAVEVVEVEGVRDSAHDDIRVDSGENAVDVPADTPPDPEVGITADAAHDSAPDPGPDPTADTTTDTAADIAPDTTASDAVEETPTYIRVEEPQHVSEHVASSTVETDGESGNADPVADTQDTDTHSLAYSRDYDAPDEQPPVDQHMASEPVSYQDTGGDIDVVDDVVPTENENISGYGSDAVHMYMPEEEVACESADTDDAVAGETTDMEEAAVPALPSRMVSGSPATRRVSWAAADEVNVIPSREELQSMHLAAEHGDEHEHEHEHYEHHDDEDHDEHRYDYDHATEDEVHDDVHDHEDVHEDVQEEVQTGGGGADWLAMCMGDGDEGEERVPVVKHSWRDHDAHRSTGASAAPQTATAAGRSPVKQLGRPGAHPAAPAPPQTPTQTQPQAEQQRAGPAPEDWFMSALEALQDHPDADSPPNKKKKAKAKKSKKSKKGGNKSSTSDDEGNDPAGDDVADNAGDDQKSSLWQTITSVLRR